MDPASMAAIGQAASSVIGRGIDALTGGNDTDQDWKRQKKVMQNSISWRVADAKRAGIHPLYALGAPTMSYSASAGSSGPSLGETLGGMGQDVSRAVAAGMSDAERRLQQLTLEKAGLENEYLRSQIASVNSRTIRESAPAFPAGSKIPEKVTPVTRTPGARIWGYDWESSPRTSDLGNYAENRYGDEGPATWMMGGLGLADDVWWNSTLRKALDEIATGENWKGESAARQIFNYLFK